ncbi:DUF3017 domain-containing protein [Streptomyces sp. NRRL WC-3549]|uniref:DUF3017 domain-containing protein n=1 Tax=Streptomyces sp. NRRL WC-3549 TaxID=1463925 RepID=UPI0004C69648|nr:DUF3017 domain-containing protein [Streptomyces sp. NRRL WC-3549]
MGAGTSPADGTRSDATRPDAAHADESSEPAGTTVPGGPESSEGEGEPGGPAADGTAAPDGPAEEGTATAGEGGDPARAASRRFSLTHDTARPEGGGRAAPGDAPAPARQWPLLTVLCTAGAGLLVVALDPFAEAFRIGAILIGAALLAGAVLRWVVPSVGMLAVRSRFTDLVTYGLMGALIVLLALMAQPKPWLDVPFLQDVVHFTIR